MRDKVVKYVFVEAATYRALDERAEKEETTSKKLAGELIAANIADCQDYISEDVSKEGRGQGLELTRAANAALLSKTEDTGAYEADVVRACLRKGLGL